MDHAHAALPIAHRFAYELGQALARGVSAQAVQVELGLDRPHAAPKLAHHFGPDAAAAERQGVVCVQQRFHIELVRQRLHQHRGFVELTLARHGCRSHAWQRGRSRLAQWLNAADGGGEQLALMLLAHSALAFARGLLGGLVDGDTLGLQQGCLQRCQLVQAAGFHAALLTADRARKTR